MHKTHLMDLKNKIALKNNAKKNGKRKILK